MSADIAFESVLRDRQPAVRLVTERQLRKVLLYLRDNGQHVPANPTLPVWIARGTLLAADIVAPSLLDGGQEPLLLLTDPDDRMLGDLPRDQQLRIYWRLLFRAAVLRTIDRKLADVSLSLDTCAQRLNKFGESAGREIRFVLESDHITDPEADDAARYRAFASIYLDLLHFHPASLDEYFPSLNHHRDGVVAMLNADVDTAELLNASRPAGAADPERDTPPDERWAEGTPPATTPPIPSAGEPTALLSRANEADAKGNFVRAAILRTRAASDAAGSLGKMVEQLAAVLEWDEHTKQEWRQALNPLLAPASAGIWPRAARSLYELQKIPNSLAQPVFAIDLPEAIRTFGNRPVKRPLPHARVVLLLMHLKQSHKQLLRAGLPESAHLRLDRLFHHEIHRAEEKIRHEFTPIIRTAIEDSGLRPTNRVEEIARDKLVAELLDRVCDRGYLRIGDLRDAIARNQLKVPDLKGPSEFFRGDALLKSDVRLAYDLDGVYRRGEFYLRWIQRLSGVFFGTKYGRLLTLYLLLPFGGSFLALTALEELQHIGGKAVAVASRILARKPPQAASVPAASEQVLTGDDIEFDPETGEAIVLEKAKQIAVAAVTASPPHHSPLTSLPVVLGFGVFLLLMFHVPPFRRAVFDVLKLLWRGIRFVLWDGPKGVLRSKFIQRIRKGSVARFANKYLAGALLAALIVVGTMWLLGADTLRILKWGGITFGVVVVLANTPYGWNVQERFAEGIADRWRLLRVNLLPGIIGGILAAFRWVANWIERQLYAVDEWLRFRGGDSKGSIAGKALLGLIWFPIAYLTRFAFYLLIEPQVNPVKHFPVVTVSHKLLLPLVATAKPQTDPSIFGGVLITQLGMGVGEANFWAFWIIAGIPGIFGFLAWELMANWRLYGANRSKKLNPVTLGSHGESMRGLLRPGFHSGTVPKLYRKMRAAGRKGDRAAVAWHHHDLEHTSEGVHRFVERELVPLLEGSPEWGKLHVKVGEVHFGCMRVVIDLLAPSLGRDAFTLSFENRHGEIEASIERAGWFDKLTDSQRAAFVAALRGLLDMAATDRVAGHTRGIESPPPDPKNPLCTLQDPCNWDDWVVTWRVPTEAKTNGTA